MRRGFTVVLLMLCLCWQALAHAGMAVVTAGHGERSHALLHFQGQSHHHDGPGVHGEHDDGGVHDDQSPSSTQHLTADACVHAPALPSDAVTSVLQPAPRVAPATAVANRPPSPFLAVPQRPPQDLS